MDLSLTNEILPEDEMIREATVHDFKAVLDADPEVYQNTDYLPATFPSLVEGQGIKGYVYLKDNTVVGFISTKLVDGGRSVLTSAGRIHPDHRGWGMYGRFNRAVLRHVTLTSGPERAVCTVSGLSQSPLRSRLLRQYRLVMEKKLTCIQMNVDEMKTELTSGPLRSLSHMDTLTPGHLRAMLSQPPSFLSHLFPERRVLLNWEPFRIMPENADVILDSCRDRVFLSDAEQLASTAQSQSSSKGSKNINFPVSFLTCGSHFPSEAGRIYDLDVFGSAGSDEEIVSHMTWHLRRLVVDAATGKGNEKTAVMMIFAPGDESERVVSLLEALFPPVRRYEFDIETCGVLEAPLSS